MNPPPGATTTDVPLGRSGRNTVRVGSVMSLRRLAFVPP